MNVNEKYLTKFRELIQIKGVVLQNFVELFYKLYNRVWSKNKQLNRPYIPSKIKGPINPTEISMFPRTLNLDGLQIFIYVYG